MTDPLDGYINKFKKTEINILILIILFYLFRTAIPILKYAFLPLYLGFFIYCIFSHRKIIIEKLNNFIRNYFLVLILAIILVISFIFSNKLYLTIFKDLVNTIILLTLFFLLSLIINAKIEFQHFVNNLLRFTIFFALLVSIHGVYNFFNIQPNHTISSSTKILAFLASESMLVDYNFALLPVFFGMVGAFYLMDKTNSVFSKVIYNLFLIICSINIFLSGSRRGLIVLFGIFILLVIAQLITVFKKNFLFKSQRSNSYCFLFSLVILIFIFNAFIFHTSYGFKIRTIEFLNEKNVYQVKEKITNTIFSYISIIKANNTYSDLYQKIWSSYFDPKDPYSWCTRNFKKIQEISGDNFEIVPEGSMGCLMDKSVNAYTWAGNAYVFNKIGSDTVKTGDFILASVYCYLSEDFNGDWVRISAEGNTLGLTEKYYDLNRKGSWQKLRIFLNCNNGIAPVYLYFSKSGATDFSELEGYVIFAYPEYCKTDPSDIPEEEFSKEPIFWTQRKYHEIEILSGQNVNIVPEGAKGCLMDKSVNGETWSGNAYMFNEIMKDSVKTGDLISASVFCYISEDFNGEWVRISAEGSTTGQTQSYYNMNRKGTWQKISITSDCYDGIAHLYLYFSKYGVTDFSSLEGYVIFAYPQVQRIHNTNNINLSSMISWNNSMVKNEKQFMNVFNSNIIDEDNTIISKQQDKNHYSNNTKLFEYKIIEASNKIHSEPFNKACLMIYPITMAKIIMNSFVDRDPVRAFVAKIFSEDTTYYGYKTNIVLDTITNKVIGGRIMRWQFAWQIFTKEYNWVKKIFGGGFAHLNWYGYFFYGDKTKSDWPHNPFISVLLYSGIFGLLIYIFFMYKVVYYYIRYFREYQILFIYFLLTAFFTFFSGDSPFDPPMMGFFVMLPFFINYVHKKQESS